jgi:hypothetical protein
MIILAVHCLEMRFFDWDQYIFSKIPMALPWFAVFAVKLVIILAVSWCVAAVKQIIKYLNEWEEE